MAGAPRICAGETLSISMHMRGPYDHCDGIVFADLKTEVSGGHWE
jgi:hypothetical protein